MHRLGFPLGAALTLGLAPFFPEPHLLGKIRWVAGGAVGMGAMDWFDLVLHGAPWVWLLVALVVETRRKSEDRAPRWMIGALAAALAAAVLCMTVALVT